MVVRPGIRTAFQLLLALENDVGYPHAQRLERPAQLAVPRTTGELHGRKVAGRRQGQPYPAALHRPCYNELQRTLPTPRLYSPGSFPQELCVALDGIAC
jgi:hypothetical protein